MAKKRKAVVKSSKPNFLTSTQVVTPALVVDQNGISWWVDPINEVIRRAVPK